MVPEGGGCEPRRLRESARGSGPRATPPRNNRPGLDDESRTKGKAAIDVVGAQSGKSVGSLLQQALLILSGASLGGTLPVMAIAYLVMLNR